MAKTPSPSQIHQTRSFDFAIVLIHQHIGGNKSDVFSLCYQYREDVSDRFNFTITTTSVRKFYLIAIFGPRFQVSVMILTDKNMTGLNGKFGVQV
ncbi:MAG: hypothetical protein H0U27_02065 [Nitrosopumilus sp.]|nr:hypothetical protein [Nitrosopumilus sp.]